MSHRPFRFLSVILLVLSLAGGLSMAVAQGGGHDHHDAHDHADDHDDHDHGHDDVDHDDADHDDHHGHSDVEGTRLLVADADGARLWVLDLVDGEVLASFGTPGLGAVHQLPDPRLAVVTHRAEHRVTIVHSGLSEVDHGDHADLLQGNPYVLATLNVGRQPTHVFARGNDLAFFNDQDGTVAWLDTRLLGISLGYTEIQARQPDHGALAVVGDHMVVGLYETGEVDVYDRAGRSVAQFGGCPGLHGQGALGDAVVFGCSDGVLIVEALAGGVFTASKVANPRGSAEGARVGTVVTDPDAEVLIGNFGAGFAIILPQERSFSTVSLPAAFVAGRFYDEGEAFVLLSADGVLRSIDPLTGTELAHLHLLHEVGSGGARPSLTVLGEYAYVSDPEHRAIIEIDLHDFEVSREIAVPFVPASLAVLAIPGASIH